MTLHSPLALRFGLTACLLAGATSAAALQSGMTPEGRGFVSGGATHGELATLHASRNDYSLWVITAASRTGAYLADVQVSITDSQGKVVFEGAMDGPWLFVDLPLGRYEIKATLKGQTQRQLSTLHAGDRHQALLYFDTGDTLSPENTSPFPNSPFGNGRK